MLALLAFVSEAKADVTCNLVSQGRLLITGPLHALPLASGWVRLDVGRVHPSQRSQIPLLLLQGLMDGKLISDSAIPCLLISRVWWKLLGSNIFHRERGQLERAECWQTIPDQAVLLSSFQASPQILTDITGHQVISQRST